MESPTNGGNGATAGYLSLPNEDFSSWDELHLIELLERSPMGISNDPCYYQGYCSL